jgi:hypothetical protein
MSRAKFFRCHAIKSSATSYLRSDGSVRTCSGVREKVNKINITVLFILVAQQGSTRPHSSNFLLRLWNDRITRFRNREAHSIKK